MSAGTSRGSTNQSIFNPVCAPSSGSPGSFRYATAARAIAARLRMMTGRSIGGRIGAPLLRDRAVPDYVTGARAACGARPVGGRGVD